ncbi:MAG: hypothetical protein DDT29_02550 [Dehalococcoidia bacterium]|nr:hypothetical protein [Bacillota bacterium]
MVVIVAAIVSIVRRASCSFAVRGCLKPAFANALAASPIISTGRIKKDGDIVTDCKSFALA